MDMTEQYRKMCEMARKEIQENWKPQSGDFVYSNLKEEVRILYFSDHHGNPPDTYMNIEFTVWLPRQDQLQEMIPPKSRWHSCTSLLFDFAEWLDDNVHNRYNTLEKAWLSFIMKETHNKWWNGEDWVKA